jgi:hypothetical protein
MALAIAAVAALLTGCEVWDPMHDGNLPGENESLILRTLTPDLTPDYYVLNDYGALVVVDAPEYPENQRRSLRTVFWPDDTPAVRDAESCATWLDQTDDELQQGAALRIETDAGGNVLRALTVTKNVLGSSNVFNFHGWDTRRRPADQRFLQVGMDIMAGHPLPWSLCARVVGASMQMKVWVGTLRDKPAWNDTEHVREVALDPEWVYEGKAGWYAGHLPPGGFASFTDLQTWRTRPA